MLMTDGEIREAMAAGKLVIENFCNDCLQPAGYDARIGKRVQRAGDAPEVDLEKTGSVEIRPGEFFLFSTREKFRLPPNMSGHLGSKTYFTYRGLVLLCGQHIDPGFSGVLVLGGYNAAPRPVVIDYEDKICNVEFHQLSKPVEVPAREYPQHAQGELPREVKDYIRGLAGTPLYQLSDTVAAVAQNVSELSANMRTLSKLVYAVVLPILGAIFAGTVTTLLVIAVQR